MCFRRLSSKGISKGTQAYRETLYPRFICSHFKPNTETIVSVFEMYHQTEPNETTTTSVSTRKVDLRVPRLQTSESYKTTGSTEVQWERGFSGNVKFIPWKSFGNTVVRTHDNIDGLKDKRLLFALRNLDLLCDFVNDESFIEGDSSSDDGVREEVPEELNESQGIATGLASRNQLPGRTFHHDDDQGDSPNEVFTDETSTLGVSNYVFMAALSLIRNLKKRKRFYFKSHSFSSEQICVDDPSIPGLPYPTTVKPDVALVTMKNSQEQQVQPICTFEFKGPGLKIQSFTNATEVENHRNVDAVASEQVEVEGDTAVWDATSQDASLSRSVSFALAQNRSVGNEDDEISDDATIPAGSCEKLCAYLNKLFPPLYSRPNAETSHRLGKTRPPRKVVLSIAQTLTQGLLSQSGCCFLFTFQVGIAFQIQSLDANGKVTVAVSRSSMQRRRRNCRSYHCLGYLQPQPHRNRRESPQKDTRLCPCHIWC